MTTVAGAQRAFAQWQIALAASTGGREFSTHGCTWVWQPARRHLVLLFPERPEPAGLRPGLAEGARLGASEVHVWMNAAARGTALENMGFREAAPVFWHAGALVDVVRTDTAAASWDGSVRLEPDLAEASGPDREEMALVAGDRIVHATARTGDGELAGRGFARLTDSGDIALHSLAVGAGFRRHGVGTALLHTLADALVPRTTDGNLVAASSPGGSGFLRANSLDLLGKGRHLVLGTAVVS